VIQKLLKRKIREHFKQKITNSKFHFELFLDFVLHSWRGFKSQAAGVLSFAAGFRKKALPQQEGKVPCALCVSEALFCKQALKPSGQNDGVAIY
jgi:hypothetical protein